MHRDFWQTERFSPPQKQNRQRSFMNIDSDTALILFLVLILQKEKSDPLLTMALLYILT